MVPNWWSLRLLYGCLKVGLQPQKFVCLQMMVDAEGNTRLNYVIADEVDELLIDDCSTPMVISSGQSPTPTAILRKIFKVSTLFCVVWLFVSMRLHLVGLS